MGIPLSLKLFAALQMVSAEFHSQTQTRYIQNIFRAAVLVGRHVSTNIVTLNHQRVSWLASKKKHKQERKNFTADKQDFLRGSTQLRTCVRNREKYVRARSRYNYTEAF